MSIQAAIVAETIFDGHRFRSRLEARWAVFFKTLGIIYEYQREAFELPSGWFLPAFWLPVEKCWIHIAPTGSSKFSEPCHELSSRSGEQVLYVVGNPWQMGYCIQVYSVRSPETTFDTPYNEDAVFAEDRKADRCLWISGDNGASSLTPSTDSKHGEDWPMENGSWLCNAYETAKLAGFESDNSR